MSCRVFIVQIPRMPPRFNFVPNRADDMSSIADYPETLILHITMHHAFSLKLRILGAYFVDHFYNFG